jgi:ankyrin repeat protein
MKAVFVTTAVFGTLIGFVLHAATLQSGSSLADAMMNRDAESVRALLKQHVNVNAPQPDGATALHWAAHWNDSETARLLIQAGANVKAASRYGATPLSEASAKGSAALIEALLNAGADPNTLTTEDGETVLMTASRTGNVTAVNALLMRGARVNDTEKFRGQTALMWAAAENHPDVVTLLLKHSADSSIRSLDRPILPGQLRDGNRFAYYPRGGMTALLFAARQGARESAAALIDGGADINEGDPDRTTALTVAIENTHYGLANLLLDRGADPNIADIRGRTPLYEAVTMRTEDVSNLPFRKDTDQTTSLEAVKALLARHADPNAALKAVVLSTAPQDGEDNTLSVGATPLMRAARGGDVEVMRLLVERGADAKARTRDGTTVLMIAAAMGYRGQHSRVKEPEAFEAVKYCLDLGLDLNTANSRGETALHAAVQMGWDSIVKILLTKGANLDVKNQRGLTPLDLAAGKGGRGGPGGGHPSTEALLRQYMPKSSPNE